MIGIFCAEIGYACIMSRPSNHFKAMGPTLKEFRLRAGLSQERLGIRLGVSANYIYLLEHGIRYPSIKMLVRLARGLEEDPGVLLNAVVERETQLCSGD